MAKKVKEAVVEEEEEVEVDPAEAKRLKKAAKKAAAEAAAAEEEVEEPQPKKKKAKKVEVEEEPAEPTEEELAEEKRKRKAAKAAAKAAAAEEAEAEVEVPKKKLTLFKVEEAEEEEEPPKKKSKKKAAEEDEEEEEAKPKKKPEAAAADADGPNPFRLFVGGIAWTVDEAQLRKDFGECGEVVDIHLLMDKEKGDSRGICFVTMSDQAGYDNALAFDGEEYAGRKLNVSKANSTGGKDGKGKGKDGKGKGKGKGKKGPGEKPDGCKSVVVKGLSYEVTDDDLWAVFKGCAEGPTAVKLLTDRDTGSSKGIAFVDFADVKGVDEAIKLNNTELKGRSFFMDYAAPREAW
ncbi:unnamed protein product [Polarella glacialis]|uniref:RRM domain-containing protein n=1 Tax=Polarella glacialis TaxID=89957 RepID=A0A813IW36_POLGL|nr:unnamed protein product [Polarella glacialis]